MESTYTSKTSAPLGTSTWGKYPGAESTLTMNHLASPKSVITELDMMFKAWC
jgi:hypothetical protein